MCWFDFGKERFRNRVAINRITFESTEKKKFGWVVLDFEKILNTVGGMGWFGRMMISWWLAGVFE